MKEWKFLQVAFLAVLVTVLPFSLLLHVAKAPPVPIGDPAYVQSNPYESNPTVANYIGIGTPSGAASNAYDGDLSTSVSFSYGASPSGYFNVSSFKNAASFAIAWVDIKICYAAEASTSDRYRIIYRVGNSAPVVLQDWVSGGSAKFGADPSSPPVRVWNNQSDPNGAWNFTEINKLNVSFETNQVTSDGKLIYLYDVWLTIYAVTPAPTPILPSGASVQPAFIYNVTVGNLVYVDIYVANVSNMNGYQFKLGFDPSVLTPIEFLPYYPFMSLQFQFIEVDNVYAAYLGPLGAATGFSGSTPIGRIYFGVVADGLTRLHLFPPRVTEFVDTLGNPFELPLNDGVFATTQFHDIQVTDIRSNNPVATHRENVNINVTVVNAGTFYETFNVTLTHDNTTIIGTQNIPYLGPGLGTAMNVTFVWNTTDVPLGSYQLEANATIVPGDINPSDNSFIDGNVLVGRHDIGIVSVVRMSPTNVTVPVSKVLNVTRGQVIYVNVTVVNNGNFTETSINVTSQWNLKPYVLIGEVKNIILGVNASRVLTFSYDTSVGWQFPAGVNYMVGAIQANASAVPYEKGAGYDFTADNEKIDGMLNVTRAIAPKVPTASFTITPTAAFVGQPVKFDASASTTPNGTTIVSYMWDFKDGNVTTVSMPIIYHKYASRGSYAVILTLTNNASLSNSTSPSPSGTVTVAKRNIAVVSVAPSPSSVTAGGIVSINVTVTNQGDSSESFNVTAYYGNTVISSRRVTGLASNASTSLIFNWNTTGVSAGNYVIKAVLQALPYETDTADNTKLDGTVSVLWHHVAVTKITSSSTSVLVGQKAVFNVTVVNEGNFTETFTVTLKYGTVNIGVQTVTNLAAGASNVLTFNWDTTGVNAGRYTIVVVASAVTGETKLDDHTLSLSSFDIVWHRIAITNVVASPTSVTAGQTVTITVSVVNRGNFTETFIVTAKYGATVIGNVTVSDLAAGASKAAVISWVTTGVASGSYVISAVASNVPGGASVSGNSVTVTAASAPAADMTIYYIAAGIIVIIIIAAVAWYLMRGRK